VLLKLIDLQGADGSWNCDLLGKLLTSCKDLPMTGPAGALKKAMHNFDALVAQCRQLPAAMPMLLLPTGIVLLSKVVATCFALGVLRDHASLPQAGQWTMLTAKGKRFLTHTARGADARTSEVTRHVANVLCALGLVF
jgi:hypothetical protein